MSAGNLLYNILKKGAHQPETGARGEDLRRDQARIPCGARAGDHGAPGPCENIVRMPLLQLGSVGHSKGGAR